MPRKSGSTPAPAPTPSPTPSNPAFWATLLVPIAALIAVFIPATDAPKYVQAACVIVAGLWALVLTLTHTKGSIGQRITIAIEALVQLISQVIPLVPTQSTVSDLENRVKALEEKAGIGGDTPTPAASKRTTSTTKK